jgi:hypothetical protein
MCVKEMRFIMFGMFAILAGCESNKVIIDMFDSGFIEETETDTDMDGYYSDEDCDDGNSNVYPNAIEICDGIDNNCDGTIDEDLLITYYADVDEDGFGDPDDSIEACNIPPGYSIVATDCDDSDATVYPASEEQCDGIDNDCNDEIDEDVTDFWYVDADFDGFGSPEEAFEGCNPGEGFVVNSSDCDDADTNINPTAEEICDEVDNDCNGTIDDDIGGIWYKDNDNDGIGDSNNITYSCGKPDGYVATSGDCNDLDGEIYPNALEFCDYIDNDCDGLFDEEDAINQPLWYQDSDNDTFGDSSSFIQSCSKPVGYVSDATDCDDTNNTIYVNAPEICDGNVNNCGSNLPEEELDQDEDGFVSCDIDNGGWDGDSNVIGGSDCDDTDSELAPATLELCDGRSNQCGLPTPIDEIDDDGDGFVECNAILDNWKGLEIIGGSDCDDSDIDIYPEALELCDGLINNCGSTLDEMEQDIDGDGYVSCSFDENGWNGDTSVIGDSDCDNNNDSIYPNAPELCDGLINTCGDTLPEVEQDLDGDNYVECTFDSNGWNGVLTIIGDEDCNDNNNSIYPNAPELCDGLINTCGNTLPEEEQDLDGDGYVECNASLQNWFGEDIEGGDDCDDDEPDIIPNGIEICDGILNSCTGTDSDSVPPNELDNDNDGYIECDPIPEWILPADIFGGGDCNDSDSTINPNVEEICDGIDNDCVQGIDNGVKETFYFDADSDGYGNPNSTTLNCSQPSNYVTNSNDCNDSNALAYNGAIEICDGSDNDCDNQIDEEVSTIYYFDADSDGYGNPNSTTLNCSQPSNYVTNSNDCNDSNALAYNGAIEICDGSDNDCDNQIDEGVQNIYFSDSDGDGYGNGNSSTYACSVPLDHVTDNSDCNDSLSSTYPGAPEVCDTVDNNCNNSIDEGVQNTYYADNDGDTLGNPSSIHYACSLPLGYSINSDDCNDSSAQATTVGSDELCARSSCLELLNEISDLDSGNYWIHPNGTTSFETYCDMDTDGGGWTRVSWNQAKDFLDGSVIIDDSASTYNESNNGPKTRDGSDSHFYYYTFKFNSGYTEFMFEDLIVKANAGNGATSDLKSSIFTMTTWEQGYSGSRGDVAFGSNVEPVYSLAEDVGTNSCKDCTYTLPDFVPYSVGTSKNRFRFGWGEKGSQSEGWYPWYSGNVYLR